MEAQLCVTDFLFAIFEHLDSLLNYSHPQLSHFLNGVNNTDFAILTGSGLHKFVYVKRLSKFYNFMEMLVNKITGTAKRFQAMG